MDSGPDFKVVMLGYSGVGKTSIVEKFYTGNFSSRITPTIAAGYVRAPIQLADRLVTLSVWDTAGQERFHSLAPLYVRDAQAAVFVFDVSAKDPLGELDTFYFSIKDSFPSGTPMFLCANKMDLVSDSIDCYEFTLWGSKRNMTLMRTSAKTGVGVPELFTRIATVISQNSGTEKAQTAELMTVVDLESPAQSDCC
jgi:small GTP-binding protein